MTETANNALFCGVRFCGEIPAPCRAARDFLFGGTGYGLIEILWRGHTHISMVITGGLCFIILRIIGIKMAHRGILLCSAVGAFAITAVEFAVGCIVNIVLDLNVWDYSYMACNLLGQVCLLYSFLWFLLCLPVFFVMNTVIARAAAK